MTVLSWLESRTPAAPDALRARVRLALGDAGASTADPFTVCLTAAAALLEQTVGVSSTGRETALDLLAADALVTYAFEAAAEDVNALDGRAVEAMHRLAALVSEHRPNA